MSKTSRAWSWRHAFASSDLPPNTRLVLHTLGMYMNELGEGCYPSVADLCRYSGLDKKTVLKHLAIARDTGWITVDQHGFRGQRWKRHEYAARWPDRDLVVSKSLQGGGTPLPPSQAEEAVETVPKAGGTQGPNVVEQLHQGNNFPENFPTISPSARERSVDEAEDFEKALRAWPTGFSDSRKDALTAWQALSSDERKTASEEIGRFVSATKAAGRHLFASFGTYLAERKWLALPEQPKQPAGSGIGTRTPPTPPKSKFLKEWELQKNSQIICNQNGA